MRRNSRKAVTTLGARLHPTLPLFGLETEGRCVLYTPGHLAVVTSAEAEAMRRAWAAPGPEAAAHSQVAMRLERCARNTVETWQQRIEAPFAPDCLTIYLSNRCNLACPYCYAASGDGGRRTKDAGSDGPVIDEETVRAAAEWMARGCAEKGKPFHLVLHGGGEPTVHWDLVQRLVALTRRMAEARGVGWWGYLATNGVLSPAQVRWLAERLDLIGLSCDGPPEVQDRQRPLPQGPPSSPFVERTAQMLAEAGGKFAVRTTITPETVERQVEMVAYLHERLGATQMRFEPVYRVRGIGPVGFRPHQAEWFVEHFLAAQQEARSRGGELTFSGVRLDEIHGPYCSVLRDVLHLTPDGAATACFFCTDSRTPNGAALAVGHLDPSTGEFVPDLERLAAHRRRAGRIPDRCQDCLNAYHCARACPEVCSAGAFPSDSVVPCLEETPGFRCLVQRQLAEAWIRQAAQPLLSPARKSLAASSSSSKNAGAATLESLLREAPASVDGAAILRQWEAVRGRFSLQQRSLPLPVWAQRGFEQDGAEAWQQLSRDFPGQGNAGPMSVYIHVPFCDRRCRFCDCYSLVLGTRNRQQEQDFAGALLREIEAWSQIDPLAHRPITTVHFGGGTPNYLSSQVFASILNKLRAHFSVTPHTEWALESTTSLLTEEHLEQLRQWGFTRLHVGVQTLEEPVRELIGRREQAAVVMEKLACALEKGFIVSVDLIYGLPGQTLPGLVATLEQLMAPGLHGFSLYQLQVSSRNRRFLERHDALHRDPLRDYVFFQVADQGLVRHGYRKNHFTHFARPEDQNLYYTHLQRGEDLLALGPTSDGVFGFYHYRHPEYEDYVADPGAPAPVLQGGVWESARERQMRPLTTALMTGCLHTTDLREVHAESLLDQWLEYALLEETPESGSYVLTANGSWFVTDLLEQLAQWVREANTG